MAQPTTAMKTTPIHTYTYHLYGMVCIHVFNEFNVFTSTKPIVCKIYEVGWVCMCLVCDFSIHPFDIPCVCALSVLVRIYECCFSKTAQYSPILFGNATKESKQLSDGDGDRKAMMANQYIRRVQCTRLNS